MNLLPLFLSLLSLYIPTSESADPVYYICNPNSKTTDNSQLSKNIDALLNKLVQDTIQTGFTATSYGESTNQIYGLAQCRGDVSKNDCATCIRDASDNARKLCPHQSDATIWYDYCFLRYSNARFFNQVDTSGLYLYNVENVTDPDEFNKKLAALIDRVSSEAVGPSSKGLGRGKSDISPFERLYALVQCTRDLSNLNCAQCASVAIGNFPTVCGNKKGCRVLYRSCYVRYELYPFFFPLESQEVLDHSPVSYESILA